MIDGMLTSFSYGNNAAAVVATVSISHQQLRNWRSYRGFIFAVLIWDALRRAVEL
jgi:hypothetical protein